MRVAIYIRVSTEHETQTTSIENQEGGALQAVVRNGWVVYDIYAERQSGLKLAKRKEFSRLMSDARNHRFEVVWVKSVTRFGRKISDLHRFVEELVRLGIRFVAELEGIDTCQSDWSTKLSMWAMFGQWESQGLSDRIRYALQVKAGRGEYTGSIPPYGYVIRDRSLVPAQDGSPETVRWIFSMYLQGWGTSRIANDLSRRHVPTPGQRTGRKGAAVEWHDSTIRKILSNPVYTGATVSCRETTKVLGDDQRVQRPEEEWIVVPNTHEALVSQEEFDAVQRRISGRPGGWRNHAQTSILTNFLFCAGCGSTMHYIRRDWGRVHYVCGRYLRSRRRKCSRRTVYEDELLADVLQHLKQAAANTGSEPPSVVNDRRQKVRKAVAALESKVKKELERRGKAQDLFIDGQMSKDEYHLALDRIEKRIGEFQMRILELQKDMESQTAVQLSPEERERLLSADALTVELLMRYVHRIEIAEDGSIHNIHFTFACPHV
ncbi:recombinase family protein [Alicyclobacillus tolerans]|uniref:DNA invertase Pin-like site-specific DNA recombinase n=1 Tax=Alicyclobacillus tolerans TaxID=90970 RepID=A0ABT9LZJ6_9BACL|nr:recombinase family protein [Alicyclobacillus tengchongensis]MDP9729698.1 DNA invertase Pin-like site-specific DNA recombinase [Alicyclobacillus tengchongensis]